MITFAFDDMDAIIARDCEGCSPFSSATNNDPFGSCLIQDA